MKLKNKNNNKLPIDYSHISDNFETGIAPLKNLDLSIKSCSDDASNEAESVDSGCVPDLTPETSWLQVSSTLKYEYSFISELLQHTLHNQPDFSSLLDEELFLPSGSEPTRSSDVEELLKNKKDEKQKEIKELIDKKRKEKIELKDAKKEVEKPVSTKGGKLGNLAKSQAKTRESKIKKQLKIMEKKREKGLKKLKKTLNVLNNGLSKQENKKIHINNVLGNGLKKKESQESKKIYNNSGQLVYSKFDFSQSAKEKWEESKKLDLNYYMNKVIKEKEKIKSLQSQGKVSDAVTCLEKNAWNKAMKKAQGEKVKDDVQKLKKSLDKKMQKKKKSQAKWNERTDNVKKQQDARQEKRKQNLALRKEKRQQKKSSKGKKKKGKNGSREPGF
ncbi:Surfeit locus protein 6-like protein [Armadillidium nasatum]|uniref:Surfeit locus protein 6-like protein n=1 Tax=Armadillidium nasatum TaxID=96803 RepID=A0A5N5SYS1_9CRUS|nr:Surfeit locus protein 6-like protein [Armadillidium nasatum]